MTYSDDSLDGVYDGDSCTTHVYNLVVVVKIQQSFHSLLCKLWLHLRLTQSLDYSYR